MFLYNFFNTYLLILRKKIYIYTIIQMYQEIENILNDSSKNDSINMVVLTGTGDFFTSGNDISMLYSIENFTSFK